MSFIMIIDRALLYIHIICLENGIRPKSYDIHNIIMGPRDSTAGNTLVLYEANQSSMRGTLCNFLSTTRNVSW